MEIRIHWVRVGQRVERAIMRAEQVRETSRVLPSGDVETELHGGQMLPMIRPIAPPVEGATRE
jgi:hypothetical protein